MSIAKKPLVVLYGAPGVGKLTVAKEIHRIAKVPLFHNHLSSDLVSSVFGKLTNYDLTNKIRLDFFEFAARNNLGLIFTFVYAHKDDDDFMNNLSEIAQKFDIKIYFIQLVCEEKIWKERLKNQERIAYKKVRDFALVKKTMENYDFFSPYPKVKNHKTLDITVLKPEKTAEIINNFIKEI